MSHEDNLVFVVPEAVQFNGDSARNNEQNLTCNFKGDTGTNRTQTGGTQEMHVLTKFDHVEQQQIFDSSGHHATTDDFVDNHYFSRDIYGTSVISEEILFQGKLSKYHAGFKNDFQPKWIVVTKSALRYYKNQESAVGNPIKPLISIPIYAIEAVEKVDFELKLNESQKVKYKDYM